MARHRSGYEPGPETASSRSMASTGGLVLNVIGDLWPVWLLLFVAFLLEHLNVVDVPVI